MSPNSPGLGFELSRGGNSRGEERDGGREMGGCSIHLDDNSPILSNKRGGSNYFKNRE